MPPSGRNRTPSKFRSGSSFSECPRCRKNVPLPMVPFHECRPLGVAPSQPSLSMPGATQGSLEGGEFQQAEGGVQEVEVKQTGSDPTQAPAATSLKGEVGVQTDTAEHVLEKEVKAAKEHYEMSVLEKDQELLALNTKLMLVEQEVGRWKERAEAAERQVAELKEQVGRWRGLACKQAVEAGPSSKEAGFRKEDLPADRIKHVPGEGLVVLETPLDASLRSPEALEAQDNAGSCNDGGADSAKTVRLAEEGDDAESIRAEGGSGSAEKPLGPAAPPTPLKTANAGPREQEERSEEYKLAQKPGVSSVKGAEMEQLPGPQEGKRQREGRGNEEDALDTPTPTKSPRWGSGHNKAASMDSAQPSRPEEEVIALPSPRDTSPTKVPYSSLSWTPLDLNEGAHELLREGQEAIAEGSKESGKQQGNAGGCSSGMEGPQEQEPDLQDLEDADCIVKHSSRKRRLVVDDNLSDEDTTPQPATRKMIQSDSSEEDVELLVRRCQRLLFPEGDATSRKTRKRLRRPKEKLAESLKERQAEGLAELTEKNLGPRTRAQCRRANLRQAGSRKRPVEVESESEDTQRFKATNYSRSSQETRSSEEEASGMSDFIDDTLEGGSEEKEELEEESNDEGEGAELQDYTWDFLGDMQAAMGKSIELCLRGICAIARRQTMDEQAERATKYANQRGFNQADAWKGTRIALFLTENNLEGPVVKTPEDLVQCFQDDPKILKRCEDMALKYANQLYCIYESRHDVDNLDYDQHFPGDALHAKQT